MYDLWVGERLVLEKAVPRYRRPGRPISVWAVPLGPGIDIWLYLVTRPHVRANRPISISSVPVSEGVEIRRRCKFISGLVRALAKLPGGSGRFLPCRVGTSMSRLRHLGWGQCSHGLASGPLESSHHQCLKAVCGVLGYPSGAASELLDGTLKLRYCTTVCYF